MSIISEDSVEIRAEYSLMRGCLELLVTSGWTGYGCKSHSVVTAVEMTVAESIEGPMPGPTFCLSDKNAQALMDELWRCGFKPSEGTGSAGALRAVENHLSDMQKLAFGYFEREKK